MFFADFIPSNLMTACKVCAAINFHFTDEETEAGRVEMPTLGHGTVKGIARIHVQMCLPDFRV